MSDTSGDRIATLERKVESLSKGSGAWWKDKVLVAVLGMVLPATALAIQRLDARSKENLDRARQESERKMQLSRQYAEREAFAIKMVVDAKKPEEKTLALEVLTVLAPPVDDSDDRDADDRHPQWGQLLAKLSEQLGKALQRGEFHDEADVDRALEATTQAAVAVETRLASQKPPAPRPGTKNNNPDQPPPGPPKTNANANATLIRLKRAATTLADKSIRQKAFAVPEKPTLGPAPIRPPARN